MKFKLKETWAKINGWPNYEVSTYGNVRNVKTGRILKLTKDKDGYLLVTLCNNGIKRTLKIHILVSKAFIPDTGHNPDGSIMIGHHQVNHKDECKTNNNLLNLEWCDTKYNNHYSETFTKATEATKKKVQCIETGDVYESTHDAELKLNLRPGSVRCQINPKQTNQHCYLQDGSKIHFKYI